MVTKMDVKPMGPVAGKTGSSRKSRKEMIAEEEARRATANAKPANGKPTPAPVEDSEKPKSKLLEQLDEVLEDQTPEKPAVETIIPEEVAPVVTAEEQAETTPATEPEVMRIGENELIALIDERLNLAIAPIQTQVTDMRQTVTNALSKVEDLFGRLEEIDLANSESVNRYATPATQAAFAVLVNEFWSAEWKPTVGNLLSEILSLKGKVESDEGNRIALNRAMPALELLTQIPETVREIKELIEAGKAIEGRIATKVAELKGKGSTPEPTQTSRFATSK